MDQVGHRRRGRPRKHGGANSATTNSRNYRDQLRAQGGGTLSTSLSPDAADALDRITVAFDRFNGLRGSKRQGTELALLLLDELLIKRGQEDLIAAAMDQNNSPGERLASFVLALGLQPIRDEMPR